MDRKTEFGGCIRSTHMKAIDMRPMLDSAKLKGTVREKLEAFAQAEGLQL